MRYSDKVCVKYIDEMTVKLTLKTSLKSSMQAEISIVIIGHTSI